MFIQDKVIKFQKKNKNKIYLLYLAINPNFFHQIRRWTRIFPIPNPPFSFVPCVLKEGVISIFKHAISVWVRKRIHQTYQIRHIHIRTTKAHRMKEKKQKNYVKTRILSFSTFDLKLMKSTKKSKSSLDGISLLISTCLSTFVSTCKKNWFETNLKITYLVQTQT